MNDRVIIEAYDRARSYFRKRFKGQDAEDMAGDFILAFIPHADQVRNPEHYTRRMMRNMVIRHWRDRGRHPVPVEDMEEYAVQDAPQAAFSDEDVSMLAHALEALEREHSGSQEAIAIWMHEDLTQVEIASILGLSSAAVRMRICRYKKRARESYAG